MKAFLYPDYYNLQVLTETLGRDEAIKLWKQYITHYIIDNRTQKNTATGVEEILERRIGGNRRDSEWVLVHGIIADGKYAYKNENCTWVDAMKELPDKELKYYVCCYGDYEYAKSYDENIVLTMEHTIAEGDPYCSRVLHDTRVNWKLEHPSKEFWDSFNPEELKSI
ncbi:MAG: L-2-amino-thiazoline-4-carboxylic acid hydrolase [Candidatus Bathyarchaeota archaeon]|nr:L-2-amino-thiazoline-4-carboxylic acid hydrolase [Candidatus Bathyarchaeota archaeon]